MGTMLLIAFLYALGLGMGWLLIRALVNGGVLSPRIGRIAFGSAAALAAFAGALGIFFATVDDPGRYMLAVLGVVLAVSTCFTALLSIKVRKIREEEQAQTAGERKAAAPPAPAPEDAGRREGSRKRWMVVLYAIVGATVLYHLIRIAVNI